MQPGTYFPTDYIPVYIFTLIALVFGIGTLTIGTLLRPKRPYANKLIPYESGIDPIGEPRQRFFVKYYIIAMLFIIFDVEVVFLYPWAVAFDYLGLYGLVEMIIFIVVLAVGYIYAWRREALDWEK
jgi:NADH-quinone oxidoreductase subunit A